MTASLLLGDWRDVLDVVVDSTISDPPYGARTHAGHNEGSKTANGCFDNELDYDHWTPEDVREFVEFWSPRTRGWLIGMTSHDLIPAWEAALAEVGRYAFAPLPYVDLGKGPRVVGDGPASWTCHIIAARPRSSAWLRDWRARRTSLGLSCSLDGAYIRQPGDVVWTPPGTSRSKRIGGKPMGLMRRLVEDYSFPGDVVCDPCAGHGTTLRAAIECGRSAVGAEIDPEAWALARDRLAAPVPLSLFPIANPAATQGDLF